MPEAAVSKEIERRRHKPNPSHGSERGRKGKGKKVTFSFPPRGGGLNSFMGYIKNKKNPPPPHPKQKKKRLSYLIQKKSINRMRRRWGERASV